MSLLRVTETEEAKGLISKMYSFFLEKTGEIPKPFKMFSISPGLFKIRTEVLGYYNNKSELPLPLLAMIRYLTASECNLKACIDFNHNILKRQGMEEHEFQQIKTNPEKAPLEPGESKMLAFVVDSIKTPGNIDQNRIDELKNLGWTENQIFDAVAYAADMKAANILMKTFKMD